MHQTYKYKRGLFPINLLRVLPVFLLLTIASLAAFSALNVYIVPVPQFAFILTMSCMFITMLGLVFSLIHIPLQNRVYSQLLPHGLVITIFSLSVIKLCTTGFSADDEIYSWNMWAIQHYQGQPASFQFTGAPYPQFFSYWIAGMYHALGTITAHSIPRLFLALPALLIPVSVIALAKISNWRVSVLISLVLIFAFRPILDKLGQGLADPLMSSAMILSAMLLISYAYEPKKTGWLWLAVICGVIASLTKQAGLIWACFSLPLTVAFGYSHYKWPRKTVLIACAGMLFAAIWPLWIAPTFINNPGVVSASMGSRSYFQQFVFAINKYLVTKPEVLLLFITCGLAVWRHAFLRLLFFSALMPMLLAWLVFGSYSMRLGMHVLALAGLLTACSLSTSMAARANADFEIQKHPIQLSNMFIAAIITILIFCVLVIRVFSLASQKDIDLKDGAKTTLRIQYGPESTKIFDPILKDGKKIWATSNYSYGAFYGRLPVSFPNYAIQPYNIDSVKKELLLFEADYAIYSGKVPYGPASELLKILAQKCPRALIPILQPPNQYNFVLYKVDRLALSKEVCE